MDNILLTNGRFADGQIRNVLIENEKISYVGSSIIKNCEIIDCSGLYILPGIIDVHTHIRDMELSYKEDWLSASKAAAAGGVTTIFDMPNTKPATFDTESLQVKRNAAKKSIVNYGYNFGVTESNHDEIRKAQPIAAIKMFMAESSSGYVVEKEEVIRQAFQAARDINKPVIVHSEFQSCVEEHERKYSATIANHNRIRNPQCAIKATELLIKLAAQTGTKVYLAHISTAQEIEMIRQAKAAGLGNLFCEVTPHHLFINESILESVGNYGKVNPPLRSEADQKMVRDGLINEVADTIGTDHAPHGLDEKNRDYAEAPSGFPGLETSLGLMLRLVHENKISMAKLVQLMSENPAKIFGIKNRGFLEPGSYADLIIVDPEREWSVNPEQFYSKAKYSPFTGMQLKGRVIKTFVNGRLAYDDGNFFEIKGKEVEFT